MVAPAAARPPALAGSGLVGEPVTLDPGDWTGSPAPDARLPVAARRGRDPRRDRARVSARARADDATGLVGPRHRDQRRRQRRRRDPAAGDPALRAGGRRRARRPGAGARRGPGEVAAAAAFAGEGLVFAVAGGGASDRRGLRGASPCRPTRCGPPRPVTVTATNSGGSASGRLPRHRRGGAAAAGRGRHAAGGGLAARRRRAHGLGPGGLRRRGARLRARGGAGGRDDRRRLGARRHPDRDGARGGDGHGAGDATPPAARVQSFAVTVRLVATVFDTAAALAEMSFVAEGAAPAWSLDAGGFARLATASEGATHGLWSRSAGDGRYRALVRWSAAAAVDRPFSFSARLARGRAATSRAAARRPRGRTAPPGSTCGSTPAPASPRSRSPRRGGRLGERRLDLGRGRARRRDGAGPALPGDRAGARLAGDGDDRAISSPAPPGSAASGASASGRRSTSGGWSSCRWSASRRRPRTPANGPSSSAWSGRHEIHGHLRAARRPGGGRGGGMDGRRRPRRRGAGWRPCLRLPDGRWRLRRSRFRRVGGGLLARAGALRQYRPPLPPDRGRSLVARFGRPQGDRHRRREPGRSAPRRAGRRLVGSRALHAGRRRPRRRLRARRRRGRGGGGAVDRGAGAGRGRLARRRRARRRPLAPRAGGRGQPRRHRRPLAARRRRPLVGGLAGPQAALLPRPADRAGARRRPGARRVRADRRGGRGAARDLDRGAGGRLPVVPRRRGDPGRDRGQLPAGRGGRPHRALLPDHRHDRGRQRRGDHRRAAR